MEEVEFCCTSGKRKSSLSDGKLRLEQKSRAARRRRMEIRRLKIVAMASSGCGRAVDLSRKRSTLGDLEGVCERGSVEVCEALSGVEEVVREVCEEEEYCCLSLEEEVRNERVERDAFGDVLDSKCCFGFVSICGKRKEMEDAVCVQPEFCCKKRGRRGNRMRFFGIFDGHGGSEAANFCKDRLHQVLAEELELPALVSSERQWRKAFTRCFSRVDGEVLSGRFTCGNNCESASDCFCTHTIASEAVGTTAVVAVIDPKQIVVANCGDSRVVLSRAGRAIALSQDHKVSTNHRNYQTTKHIHSDKTSSEYSPATNGLKSLTYMQPDRADEMARIEAAGGHVIFWDGPRVSGVLAMSRAIGDKYLKPYVISEPDVTVTERNNDDECLILASDGLWDVLSNEVVCEVARRCLSGKKLQSACAMGSPSDVLNGTGNGMSRSSTAAALLTQLALAKGSQDNISVVVVDLKQRLDTLSQS